MATIVREERYIKADYNNNNNKFWYIRQYDNHSVTTEFGRVGSTPQTRTKGFSDEYSATKFLEKKCAEKSRDGRNGEIAYRKLNTVEGTGSTSSGNVVETSNLAQIAKEDIKFNSPEVEKLITYLTNVNAHNIVAHTNISYNKQTGLFETPCGIVTKDGVDEARKLLSDIGKFVESNDLSTKQYGNLINDYLMLIPQDVGRKLDPTRLYTSMEDIYKQNDILDSLEASYQQILTKPVDDSTTDEPASREKVFSVDLNLVEDGKIIDAIRDNFYKSRSTMHTCSNYKVKKVYTVDIEHMVKAFEERGKARGNIMSLWHGTKSSNLLSILKVGMIIPPSNASHCTGRLYGNGVYFSSVSTKALNYATNFWGGSSEKRFFMFLADVAMGKYYTPQSTMYDAHTKIPKMGYDSCYAKPNVSRLNNGYLKNSEMIVYDTAQCNLQYLIEFEG